MKKLSLLTLTAVLASHAAFAQAPAADPAAPATTTTTAPATEKKAKPYSSGDVQKIAQVAEGMLFTMKMGERAKYKKDDKEFSEFGTKIHKETADLWTPLVNLAQAHHVDGKNIPTDITKADKSDIEKLGKVKEDKFKLEYYELFAKGAKKNARVVEAAAKGFGDPELKQWAEGASKTFTAQAEMLEKEYKELKSPKKDAAKK